MQIDDILIHPNEESGIFNHHSRITRDERKFQQSLRAIESFKDDKYLHIYSSRVMVLTDSLDKVKLIQLRLPEYFHDLEPMDFEYWVNTNARPEPNRITYIPLEYYKANREEIKQLFSFAYSVIMQDNFGNWFEVRDQSSTKWGNANTSIYSNDVLNGKAVL